ncbi:mannitol dehydrogenase family protein [Rubellimicrobium sp. CFH 75288]|uniref:mannitol dehydrogenase family protein n=1 Tax=Rubellimicrobium sp. CFH 75288 TaxID=2697034 RepID=UPI001FB69B76|nr:mannitol dehydrogenase family protein [Rubellimicrobium sp. CFH 75288]
MRLSNAALSRLPAAVRVPRYDRAALSPGIVHIGVGNFHRAHLAWYTHRLFDEGRDHDWAIIGSGVRPQDAAMRDRLAAQDWLSTLIELDPAGERAEVIGPMIDFLPVEEGHAPLIARLADPAIRIVSLTVTEGGYFIDPATGGFDADHPDIRHDAAHPDRPRTAFGAIVAGLARRRAAGHTPFTGLSCDNLQGNGHALARAVLSLARLSDPGLADWIERHGAFPNSMVDCIVPATGPREIEAARRHGIEDAAPVTHENFRQWVLEDHFPAGRPSWEAVGATFSDDVAAFEAMKLRIINAGHQIIANPGEVLGLSLIAECMAHPLIAGFLARVTRDEIAPLVRPVPGMTPLAYAELAARRFANPAVRDTVRRVAFDGSSRHPGFVLPTIRDALREGRPVSGLALAEALWARMCEGTREDGTAIEPNDPHWPALQAAARAARSDPRAWLAQRAIYGDLAEAPAFAAAFGPWLDRIWRDGVATALGAYVAAGDDSAPAA